MVMRTLLHDCIMLSTNRWLRKFLDGFYRILRISLIERCQDSKQDYHTNSYQFKKASNPLIHIGAGRLL